MTALAEIGTGTGREASRRGAPPDARSSEGQPHVMAIELKMPALSPTMEEGTLARWLVKEGDAVSSGDLLAEIETDKATMEYEAIDEGVIGQILIVQAPRM